MTNHLLAKFWRYSDGSSGLTATGHKSQYRVRVGPGFSAVISKHEGDLYTEAFVSGASHAAANVSALVRIEKHLAEKLVLTEYADQTTRHDSITIAKEEAQRSTEWQYPNGVTVIADYIPGGRNLAVLKKDGSIHGVFHTSRSASGGHFQALTHPIFGPTIASIYGNNKIGPLVITLEASPGSSSITNAKKGVIPDIVSISKGPDGSIKFTQATKNGHVIQGYGMTALGPVKTFLQQGGTLDDGAAPGLELGEGGADPGDAPDDSSPDDSNNDPNGDQNDDVSNAPPQTPDPPQAPVSTSDTHQLSDSTTATVITSSDVRVGGTATYTTSVIYSTKNSDGSVSNVISWSQVSTDGLGDTTTVDGEQYNDGSSVIKVTTEAPDGTTTTDTKVYDNHGQEVPDVVPIFIPPRWFINGGTSHVPTDAGTDPIPKARLPFYSAPVNTVFRNHVEKLDPFIGASEVPFLSKQRQVPSVEFLHAKVNLGEDIDKKLGGWSILSRRGIDIASQVFGQEKSVEDALVTVLLKWGTVGVNRNGILAARKAAALFEDNNGQERDGGLPSDKPRRLVYIPDDPSGLLNDNPKPPHISVPRTGRGELPQGPRFDGIQRLVFHAEEPEESRNDISRRPPPIPWGWVRPRRGEIALPEGPHLDKIQRWVLVPQDPSGIPNDNPHPPHIWVPGPGKWPEIPEGPRFNAERLTLIPQNPDGLPSDNPHRGPFPWGWGPPPGFIPPPGSGELPEGPLFETFRRLQSGPHFAGGKEGGKAPKKHSHHVDHRLPHPNEHPNNAPRTNF